jgi:hypothetical protein
MLFLKTGSFFRHRPPETGSIVKKPLQNVEWVTQAIKLSPQ